MSKSFLNPHEIETIPGTEGWERMYPYQYQFVTDDPERKKYEEETFWFYDGLHYPEPLYPFDTIWDEAWYLALSLWCRSPDDQWLCLYLACTRH